MADRHPDAAPDRLAVDGLPHPHGGGLQGVGIGAGVRYVSPVAGAPDNTLKVPGYALFDAALFYNVGRHWRLALNGTNLANREVISGCYDATRCIYANGRTVLASAKYAW